MRELPVRKNIRLKGYDYSNAGCYYITVCVKDRLELLWNGTVGAAFGRLSKEGLTPLSETGLVIDTEIKKINSIYDCVEIVKYVIMPNHIHMIIALSEITDTYGRPKAAPTISRILNKFKSSISKQLGYSIWQKLFHDHIIRNDTEYKRIWQYIDENPGKWEEDEFYGH